MTTVKVNAEAHTFPDGTTVPEMLAQLELEPRLVVVEYNGLILHRQDWPCTLLADGDVFEVVTVVGGG
ncbi:MAG: thiamine biosynthesis protein ThiS [Gemmatimonadaceae bacterium]|nr:thiamine biosynthesis protein ThiS [Gloeobacterales cyanobacterium ES-bin-141]